MLELGSVSFGRKMEKVGQDDGGKISQDLRRVRMCLSARHCHWSFLGQDKAEVVWTY